MRILIVASDFPWPSDHGGRKAVAEHSLALSSLGHEVDLIVTTKSAPDQDAHALISQTFNSIVTLPRTASPTDLLSLQPFQIVSRRALCRVRLKQTYDLTILEGCYVADILNNPDLKSKRVFYRVHNIESNYFSNLAISTRNPLMKLFYKLESLRFSKIEKKLMKIADATLFISSDEFSGSFGQQARNPIFFPPAIDLKQIKTRSLHGRIVIFIGSLFMPNNQRAIRWYLKNIHPYLCNIDGYHLIIAGRADAKLNTLLSKEWALPKVEIVNSPEDLEVIYEKASIFVNPAQESAGVKIKTIEAIRNGIPVVSTPEGVSGSGLKANEHVRLAETTDDFRKELVDLLKAPQETRQKLATRATQFLIQNYDMQKNIKELFENHMYENGR